MSSMQGEMAMFHDENRLIKDHGKCCKLGEVSSDKILVEPPKFQDFFPSFDDDDVIDVELAHYCCGESDNHLGDFIPDFGDEDEHTLIPDMNVPPNLLDFTRDMIAKSDDKTVVATYISPEINSQSQLIEIFKRIGDVRSATLAIGPNTGLSQRYGVVTFFTKEVAQKAIEELNGSVWDEVYTMYVDWVRKT